MIDLLYGIKMWAQFSFSFYHNSRVWQTDGQTFRSWLRPPCRDAARKNRFAFDCQCESEIIYPSQITSLHHWLEASKPVRRICKKRPLFYSSY